MRIFDISAPISPGLHTYAGDPPTQIEPWTRMAAGDLADVSRLSLGTHTGTHIDAPAHFLLGAETLDKIDLSTCIGPAQVIDLTALGSVSLGASVIAERTLPGATRVLLKTQNSQYWELENVQTQFSALTLNAAERLVEQRVRLVGIDYLSIAPYDDPAPVHRALLQAGIIILEGLNLGAVPAGMYQLVCLPLRVAGADGAPARAVLLSEES